MRIKRVIADDQLEIESLTKVAGSLPFTFTELLPDGSEGDPIDISGITPRFEITDGDPNNPGSTVYLTLAEGSGITRDDVTGTFTVAVTMAQMDPTGGLAVGNYAFRFLWFEGSECVDRPFYGRWQHVKAR